MSYAPLESQPSFPRKDISCGDADMLELLLANETLFRNGHAAAESSCPTYKLGHDTLTRIARPIFEDE